MATQQRKTDLQYGLSLDRAELAALDTAEVRAQTRVTPVRQPKGNLVLTCEESGGGAKDVGHYVGYLPLQGPPSCDESQALFARARTRCIGALSRRRLPASKSSATGTTMCMSGSRSTEQICQAMKRSCLR